MVEAIRPGRGGFLRPFGAAWFIVEFLKGNGPVGSAKIDPEMGAPQQDIHASYKLALHMAIAEDMVAWEQEERVSQGLPVFTPEEWEERKARYLERVPSKLTKMRYHSFLVYFGLLKRLGWVETTGEVENSDVQEKMAMKPGEDPRQTGTPRVYYRLTRKGLMASSVDISDPIMTLYGYSREQRSGKRKKYYVPRKRG